MKQIPFTIALLIPFLLYGQLSTKQLIINNTALTIPQKTPLKIPYIKGKNMIYMTYIDQLSNIEDLPICNQLYYNYHKISNIDSLYYFLPESINICEIKDNEQIYQVSELSISYNLLFNENIISVNIKNYNNKIRQELIRFLDKFGGVITFYADNPNPDIHKPFYVEIIYTSPKKIRKIKRKYDNYLKKGKIITKGCFEDVSS